MMASVRRNGCDYITPSFPKLLYHDYWRHPPQSLP